VEKAITKEIISLEKKKTAEFIKKLEEKTQKSKQELFNFTIGLVEQKTIKELKDLLKKILPKSRSTSTKAKKILLSASNRFQKSFKKLVWNYRCEKRIEIDKIKGIDFKKKRNKPSERPKDKGKILEEETNKITAKTQKKIARPIDEELNGNREVLTKIYDWVRGGIRWLGL
jgi:hypothetical protein